MEIGSLKDFPVFLLSREERRGRAYRDRMSRAVGVGSEMRTFPFVPVSKKASSAIRLEAGGGASSPGNASQGFEVVLIDRKLSRKTLRFASEDLLIKCLKDTYETLAPVRITYADGSPVPSEMLNRINRKLYKR
jgi:hypothetical protein